MKIETPDYTIIYNEADASIMCTGSLRLNGTQEYAPILNLFNTAAEQKFPVLTIDLKELRFLNSSGINILSKFVISMRQQQDTIIRVIGSKAVPWQGKSLKNLQRLMTTLELNIE